MKKLCPVLLFGLLILTACGNKAPTWQEQYDLGVRYLTEGNYQEAILAFTAAIEIDPMQTDTYEGLAKAYVAVGEHDKAIEILAQGYEMTQADSLLASADNVRLDVKIMDAAKSYLEVLEERQTEINAYHWQYGNRERDRKSVV